MFKSNRAGERKKVPTFNQFMRDCPQNEPRAWDVHKILWGDVYRTITFFTEAFRYTVKLPDKDEYKKACNVVMGAFQYYDKNSCLCEWTVHYDPESEEVEVSPTTPAKGLKFHKWKQWDWGWTRDGGDELFECKPPKAPKVTTPKQPSASPTA